MIKMIPMTCPKCGASLEIKEGTSQCFCTYCGTKILVNDDSVKTININKTSSNRTISDSVKSFLDYKERKEIREENIRQQESKKTDIGCIILITVCLIIIWLVGK